MLEAGAPIDLVGMAGEFVADEMLHTELNARMAMQLGGGAPYLIDFASLSPRPAPGPALQRAAELAVRISCVAEAFSVPMLVGTMRAATHPLTHAVLERIARDEAPHARVGWLFLEWAGARLDDVDRSRLADVALAGLRDQSPYWTLARSKAAGGMTSEGFLVRHVNELGWMEAEAYGREARRAVRAEIVEPLARHGIVLDEGEVTVLLA
jgi:hypothetical protein